MLGQDERVIVSWIFRSVEKRSATFTRERQQRGEGGRVGRELGTVAPSELSPAPCVVAEPLSQRCARCDLGQPCVERRAPLCDAARPEPIDEHADAVRFCRGFVNAL